MTKVAKVVSTVLLGMLSGCAGARADFPVEFLTTEGGEKISLVLINHGSIAIRYRGKTIQIDPVEVKGKCSYESFQKADAIFITHGHQDHFDMPTLEKLRGADTTIFANGAVAKDLPDAKSLANGEQTTIADDISVFGVPAYNTTPDHQKFHPKGVGNGYVFTIGGKRIYVAGDTEDIQEMAELKDIDVAFLPVNQPYTMTPAQCAKAVQMIKPKLVIPYHMGQTDLTTLEEELKNSGVEAKIYEALR